MRNHPHLYEINTWPWLTAMTRAGGGARVTLGAVPDDQWDALASRGIDLVYLLGVWKRSAIGRELARAEPSLAPAFDRALPGWRPEDVVGSAFSVAAYAPDPAIGGWDDVDAVREKLHARGMRLVLDFIVNHTGFDHPWVAAHPDWFVTAKEEVARRDPTAFRAVNTADGVRYVACGRDPFFPPWSDVAQLNHFNAGARAALVGELQTIARHADGVRCDMAMLALTDVFAKTWTLLAPGSPPATEFWADARAAAPDLLLLAEVYWDLEWRLQQLGFDFTYDKRLYDRLLGPDARAVHDHLSATREFQWRSARFIENHDEEPSAPTFGDRVRAAAVVISTIEGLRFFHDGQFTGRQVRVPVQLGAAAENPPDAQLAAFYEGLLEIADDDLLHTGDWRLLDVVSVGDATFDRLVAWRWKNDRDLRIIVVNLGDDAAQARIAVSGDLPRDAEAFVFDDVLNGVSYDRRREDLEPGLYVRLAKGAAHIFRVVMQTG